MKHLRRSGTPSTTRAALVLIFVLAVGVRLAYYIPNPHSMEGPWGYGELAHNIVDDGHWFQFNTSDGIHFLFTAPLPENNPRYRADFRSLAPSEANLKYADAHPRWKPFIWEPVGESVLLAGLWEVTGSQTYSSDVFMKIVLDALTALLLYRIAMRLFGRRRAALVASLLYALYPPIAELIDTPDRAIWSLDFTIAILAVYLEAINSTRPGRWLLACGALTGIAAYFDSGIVILPAALALAAVAVTGWRATLRRALIPTAIAVLTIVPWTIRNYNDFHTFVFMRPGIGENLWLSLIKFTHLGTTGHEYENIHIFNRLHPNLHWETPAWDTYLRNQALTAIEHHPLYYLEVVARAVWTSTLGQVDAEWMRTGTKTPFAYAHGPFAYAFQHPFQLLQVALMPSIFLLAMLSLRFTWKRYKHEHLLLIAAALANTLPYIFLHYDPRYMMAAAISYFIWIGLGSDLLLERLSLWRADRRGQEAHGALAA